METVDGRFHFGNVWLGDLFHESIKMRFGKGKQHYAIISDRDIPFLWA